MTTALVKNAVELSNPGKQSIDEHQFSEQRLEQLGRIRQKFEIRIGHEPTLTCGLNRAQLDFARARVHPELHLRAPEIGRALGHVTRRAARFCREDRG